MNKARRTFIQSIAALSAGALTNARALATGQQGKTLPCMPGMPMPGCPDTAVALPVLTPDVPDLPFEIDNGVKVFHLIAEPVKQTILPGKVINLWGYNGSAPGPTIQVNQGDRVRIIVDNHLPEPTSMHWHGFEIPFDMDGAPGFSQEPISPGGSFTYEFTLHQEGTYFYHSHMAMQEMMGMIGGFVMHPTVLYSVKKICLIPVACETEAPQHSTALIRRLIECGVISDRHFKIPKSIERGELWLRAICLF